MMASPPLHHRNDDDGGSESSSALLPQRNSNSVASALSSASTSYYSCRDESLGRSGSLGSVGSSSRSRGSLRYFSCQSLADPADRAGGGAEAEEATNDDDDEDEEEEEGEEKHALLEVEEVDVDLEKEKKQRGGKMSEKEEMKEAESRIEPPSVPIDDKSKLKEVDNVDRISLLPLPSAPVDEMPSMRRDSGSDWGERSEEEKEERTNKLVAITLSFLSVLLYTLADTALHLGHTDAGMTDRTASDQWIGIAFRAIFQIVVSIAAALVGRSLPWGTSGNRVMLVVMACMSALLVVSLDFAQRNTYANDAATISLLLPLFVFIFGCSLVIEPFAIHRVIGFGMLILSALLSTQPQLFGGTAVDPKSGGRFSPIFCLDVIFSWPISVQDQPTDNQSGELQPRYDLTGLVFLIMVPVLSSYMMMLVYISKEVNYAVITLWMALGALAGGAYCYMLSGPALAELAWPVDAVSWTLHLANALVATLATLLFVRVIRAVNPVRAIFFRFLELVLVFVLQLAFKDKAFILRDLIASVLVLVALAHVLVELLFY